jgi:hypothetical protein
MFLLDSDVAIDFTKKQPQSRGMFFEIIVFD